MQIPGLFGQILKKKIPQIERDPQNGEDQQTPEFDLAFHRLRDLQPGLFNLPDQPPPWIIPGPIGVSPIQGAIVVAELSVFADPIPGSNSSGGRDQVLIDCPAYDIEFAGVGYEVRIDGDV